MSSSPTRHPFILHLTINHVIRRCCGQKFVFKAMIALKQLLCIVSLTEVPNLPYIYGCLYVNTRKYPYKKSSIELAIMATPGSVLELI